VWTSTFAKIAFRASKARQSPVVPSQRSQVGRELNPRALTLLRLRAGDTALWDLTTSNPTRAGIVYQTAQIRQALSSERALSYDPEPLGMYSARAAVAELWAGRGIVTEPESVLLTASTSEAYSHLFKLLCDPADDVLVPQPSYPLFEQLARLETVTLRPYRLDYDGAWHIDLAHLAAQRGPRTRAVIVVSPNNPTGSFLKREELARLEELGLPIISDEVFAEYASGPDARRAVSALESSSALVFALGGLSKHAALPQLKLAWTTISGPPREKAECLARLEHIADTYLSVASPVQLALPTLLACSVDARTQIRARLALNIDSLRAGLRGSPVTPLHTEGGWYVVLRLPALLGEEEWVLGLLEEASVLVEPGYFYDFEREPFVVVSLLTPEAVFDEGLERIRSYVERRLR
jgi:aspartate/methionine/tyrosine aminotransferase